MREKWDMYRLYMDTRTHTERRGRSSSDRRGRSRLNRAAVPANRHRPWTLLKTLKYLHLPAYVYVYRHMHVYICIDVYMHMHKHIRIYSYPLRLEHKGCGGHFVRIFNGFC